MYEKTTWTTTTLISAEKMNHLETQYDEFKKILDSHNHDSRYYQKWICDSRYFWSGHMGAGSGADADLLDGYHLSEFLGAALPVGAICIWRGSAGTIPTGWRICDGGGGTPDLRDRFVCGGTLQEIGETGGVSTITTMGGTVSTAGTVLSTSQIPSHRHTYTDYYGSGSCYGPNYAACSTHGTDISRTTQSTGSNAAHDHGTFGVTFSSFQNMPPYYALYYIMKVS